MKAASVCALVLATVALASGEGGAISVFNNATFSPYIHLTYNSKDGSKQDYLPPPVSPGKTETVAFPEGAGNVYFSVFSESKVRPFKVTELFRSLSYLGKHPNMCLMASGTGNDLHIGQIDCSSHARVSRDGGAISVANNAAYSSRIVLDYKLSDEQGTKRLHKEVLIGSGETNRITIPKGAKSINVGLRAENRDIVGVTLSQPVRLCFMLRGTIDVPKSSQIDC